jgi:hypothetical protein
LQLSRDIPYYSIFTVPKGGEAGGVASGSESYYSYDVGNIHFISLDSYGMENGLRLSDTLSQQVEWLKKDLASNEKMWTVAYFHHPPYTKGSHDSDTENELVRIRQYTVGILERFNVDLVLSGHSHSYERTRLISNHFGLSGTFDQRLHEIDSSSARYDGTVNSCPYIKNESNRGTVYVVAGSAGQVGGNIASYPHKAMYYSNRTMGGSGILEIESNRLDFKWLSGAGVIEDSFTILKTVGVNTERTVNAGDPITLAASWVGTYQWENDPELSSPSLSPIISRDSLFVVRDEHNCVADSTRIRIGITTEVPGIEPFISVYPNPADESFSIDTGTPGFHRMDLFDAQGRLVMQRDLELQNTFDCHALARGVYVVMLIGKDRVMRRKILLR